MTRSDCINASVLNGSAKGRTTWLERGCSQWKRQFGRGGRRSRELGAASWELVVESRRQVSEISQDRPSAALFREALLLVRGRLPMRQIIQDSQHERTKNNQYAYKILSLRFGLISASPPLR